MSCVIRPLSASMIHGNAVNFDSSCCAEYFAFSIPIAFAKEASVGAWRSLVAHLFWVQGVGSSNLLAPTIFDYQIELMWPLRLCEEATSVSGPRDMGNRNLYPDTETCADCGTASLHLVAIAQLLLISTTGGVVFMSIFVAVLPAAQISYPPFAYHLWASDSDESGRVVCLKRLTHIQNSG